MKKTFLSSKKVKINKMELIGCYHFVCVGSGLSVRNGRRRLVIIVPEMIDIYHFCVENVVMFGIQNYGRKSQL
jgi:hypothetical protein